MKTKVYRSAIHSKVSKLSIILFCAVYIAGCSSSQALSSEPVKAEVPQVKVEAVGKHSMGEPREQIAEVNASARIDIIVESGGALVTMVKQNGERVQAGEVIAKIESRAALIEREKAEIALRTAELNLSVTTASMSADRLQLTSDIEKLKELLKQQVRDDVAVVEQEETKRSLQSSMRKLEGLSEDKSTAIKKGEVETARLTLEQAELAWNDGQILSPANGVLTDVKLNEGMTIPAGSVFGIIQKTDMVKIKAQLTESATKLVRNKKEITFVDSNGDKHERSAKVVYLSDVPDATTRLYALELEADNAAHTLKPSTRVHLQLTTPEEETVIAVPSLSILREESAAYVFVINGNKAEKRKVELGRVNGPYQEVISGVTLEDSLVVSGQHALTEGQTIQQ